MGERKPDSTGELGRMLIVLALAIPLGLWFDFTVWCLWGWHVEPLTGVSLGFWTTVGLTTLVGLMYPTRPTRKADEPSATEALGYVIGRALVIGVALAGGWLAWVLA